MRGERRHATLGPFKHPEIDVPDSSPYLCDSPEAIERLLGQEPRLSGYLTVTQGEIDIFAGLSGDRQWLHVDPERAAASPWGSTIAHGFLTLGLMGKLYSQCFGFPGRKSGLNYGFDRIRFVSAVPVDARIRGRFALHGVNHVSADTLNCSWDATVEIEGRDKPAVVARWLTRVTY